jgi:DNA-binding NarL/FixJ family response regulator
MSSPIRVLLADDHALVRKGFRRLLEDYEDLLVVAEATNGREAVEMVAEHQPDVVVLDVTMPEMDGLRAAFEIRSRHPSVAILVLSMHADSAYQRTAREAGASGYLLKSSAELDLYDAIRTVARGESLFPDEAQAPRSEDEKQLDLLTPRERQVLQLLASGKANKEIAALLNVSVNTVAVHRARLMDTLGIRGTAELTLFAVRCGLVTPR